MLHPYSGGKILERNFWHAAEISLFFKSKAEQSLQGMELQEKEAQKD